jgi:hypothetical protein
MSLQSKSEKPGISDPQSTSVNSRPEFTVIRNNEPSSDDSESYDDLDDDEKEEKPLELSTLPDSVYEALPHLLKRAVSIADSNEERDILLLGSITVLGGCMPNIYGFYNGDKVYPNLYLFVTSPPSGGKGKLNRCKSLVAPIHSALCKESKQLRQEYNHKMREYLVDRKKNPDLELPRRPPEKMLLIPANNSASGVFQLLYDNNGKGIIFETEGDTLSLAFKTKYGDYSDGYRKAYHHERISYYRRTDHEYVDIESPQLSSVLAGTFNQVASLIPSAENGLFSRFIFYYINMKPVWKDVFARSGVTTIDDHLRSLGDEYFKLYEVLNKGNAIQFCYTHEQKEAFHQFFTQLQKKYLCFQGLDYIGTIRRLGLISFRIAMIFNTLRMMETGDFSKKQQCRDEDFYTSLNMITVLIKHASFVFTNLQHKVRATKKVNKKEQFLYKLPEKFSHSEYIKIAKELGIKERSADGYMAGFCNANLIKKEQRDKYIHLSLH